MRPREWCNSVIAPRNRAICLRESRGFEQFTSDRLEDERSGPPRAGVALRLVIESIAELSGYARGVLANFDQQARLPAEHWFGRRAATDSPGVATTAEVRRSSVGRRPAATSSAIAHL